MPLVGNSFDAESGYGTAIRVIGKIGVAAVQVGDFADEGEAEAGALLAGGRARQRVEAVEYLGQRVVRGAAAVVAYVDVGVFVTGFGYPVVAEGTARVRVQMSAALEPAHLERALAAFVEVGRESGLLR